MIGDRPSVVIVGSHVKKTTEQLEKLLQIAGVVPVEIDVARLIGDDGKQAALILAETCKSIEQIHASDKTAVVFTSRDNQL